MININLILFYFSFEHLMCLDYITEKLYESMEHDIVPVILSERDFKKNAPPNSVINAFDFKSPKDLAEYLLRLDRNPDLYMKYLQWPKII